MGTDTEGRLARGPSRAQQDQLPHLPDLCLLIGLELPVLVPTPTTILHTQVLAGCPALSGPSEHSPWQPQPKGLTF